jgi:hypothetical protein
VARHLIVITRCPLCGKQVEQVPDGVLKQNPHLHDTEMVVTRTGLKQYIHSSCWYKMIEEKRPYDGKLYM